MPRRDAAKSRNGWRIAAIVVSAALGVAAICLVVFSTTAKQSQIGVLLGAWAVFIAAPTIFGNRRAQQHAAQVRDAQQHAAMLHDAQLHIARLQETQVEAASEAQKSQEVELRRFGELQLARETAARREADFRLEIALRGEIERVLTEQIGSLRDEVSSLRAEVVEKLGGQLRLEHIETTRVIASDLEALQSEIRRLGGSQESLAAPAEPSAGRERTVTHQTSVTSGRADSSRSPASPEDDILDAEVIEHEPEPQRPVSPEPVRAGAVTPERVRAESERAPVSPPPARPAPGSEPGRRSVDPFAGLPRLSPLPPEFADLIDPIIVPSPAAPPQAPPEAPAEPSADDDDAGDDEGTAGRPGQSRQAQDWTAGRPRYVGRRRAAGEADAESEPSGGRRRAPEDAPDDLFTRSRSH